jgi:hypothetical protein
VEPDGTVLGFFDREAPAEQDAVISAIVEVEHAGIGARVLRVQADDDWLTASEIAERVGRSRQSVALLARGERGPGDFPAPVARRRSSNPLWSWSEVEAWFERYEPEAFQHTGQGSHLTSSPSSMIGLTCACGSVFDTLLMPPWRPKLNEALPLGA